VFLRQRRGAADRSQGLAYRNAAPEVLRLAVEDVILCIDVHPEAKGINPFTKEEMTFKAKPAVNSVKLVPLKGLKAMVQATPSESTDISAKGHQTDQGEENNMVSEGGPNS